MGLNSSDLARLGSRAQKQIMEKLQKKNRITPSPSPAATALPKESQGCCAPAKYHNVKAVRVMPNGEEHVFDSQKEARRYDDLMMLLRAGQIRELKLQPQFTLQESYIAADGNRVRAIKYVADFSYEKQNGTKVVEDVKSKATETRVYRLKKKLMQEKFGIGVREV